MFRLGRKHAAPCADALASAARAGGEAIGAFGGEPLDHGSLDTADYHELLDDNGFAVVSHVVEDVACQHHTIWLAQLR